MHKIAIFGYGNSGVDIARELPKKEVYIFVFDEKEYKKAKDNGYLNVELLDSLDDDILEELGLENYTSIISLLDDEVNNLFLCLSIKTICNKCNLVAIVKDRSYENRYKLAGVDKIINPYDVSSKHITNIIKRPLSFEVLMNILFEENKLEFSEISVIKNSFLDTKSMNDITFELKKEYNLIIIGILDTERSDKFEFVTKGINHYIDEGDVLVVLGDLFDINRLKDDMEESVKWHI